MTPEYARDQLNIMNNQNNSYPSSDMSDFMSSSKRVGNIDKNQMNMLNLLSSANNASNSINTTAALDAILESHLQQRRLSLLAASESANNQDFHPSIDSDIGAELMNLLRAGRRRSSLMGANRSSNENTLGDANVLASLANKIRRNSLLGSSFNLGETLDSLTRSPGEFGVGESNMDLCNLSNRLNKRVGDHDDLGARSESTLGQNSGSNFGSRLDVDSELQFLIQHKMQQEEDLKAAIMNTGIMEGNGGSSVTQHQQQQMRRLSLITAMNSVGNNGDNPARRGSLASLLCDDMGRQESLLSGSSSHQSRRNDLLLGLEARRRTSLSFLNAANRRDSFTGSCSSRRGSFLGNTSNGGPSSRSGSLIGAIGAGDAMFPGRTMQRRGSLLPIDPNEMEDLFDDHGTASSLLGQSNLAALQMQLHELQRAQMRIAANTNPSLLGRNISTLAAVDALKRLSNASECTMANERSAILGQSPQASSLICTSNLNDKLNGNKNHRNIKNDSTTTGMKPENMNKDSLLTDREGIDSSIAKTTTEMFKAFSHSMNKSQISQKNIQQWDKKMGLKKSHSITMTKTTQSRKMLRDMFEQELRIMFGLIVDLSGKEEMGELKIKKKRGRKKGSKNKKKVRRDSCDSTSSTGSINSAADPKDGDGPDDKDHAKGNEGKQRVSKGGLKRGSLTGVEHFVVDEMGERGKRHRFSETSSNNDLDNNNIEITQDLPKTEPLLLIKSEDMFNPTPEISSKNINLSWENERSSQLDGLSTLASCIQQAEEKEKRNSDMRRSKFVSKPDTQRQEIDIILLGKKKCNDDH